MGIDWWEHDPTLSSGQRDLANENRRLRERVGALEAARYGVGNDGGGDGDDRGQRVPHGREATGEKA